MEEEIEESIIIKKEPVNLTGKNFFLYLFLFFNTLAGLYILSAQLTHKTKSTHFTEGPHRSQAFKSKDRAHFVKFELIVTNLAEYDGPRRYVRVRPVIEVKEGRQYEEISLKKNTLRNQIIAYLNILKPDEILGETGMANLKAEIKKIFKKTLTHTQIDMLYFSEFRVN
ncbi:MAG: flagellar basal body-associated FliL family protein [Deltaproteobacteria bacterium]|nr:MAG: flagellar basal body-associated FliL family protein [Deltaproteobacteria bacterium]